MTQKGVQLGVNVATAASTPLRIAEYFATRKQTAALKELVLVQKGAGLSSTGALAGKVGALGTTVQATDRRFGGLRSTLGTAAGATGWLAIAAVATDQLTDKMSRFNTVLYDPAITRSGGTQETLQQLQDSGFVDWADTAGVKPEAARRRPQRQRAARASTSSVSWPSSTTRSAPGSWKAFADEGRPTRRVAGLSRDRRRGTRQRLELAARTCGPARSAPSGRRRDPIGHVVSSHAAWTPVTQHAASGWSAPMARFSVVSARHVSVEPPFGPLPACATAARAGSRGAGTVTIGARALPQRMRLVVGDREFDAYVEELADGRVTDRTAGTIGGWRGHADGVRDGGLA